MFIVYFLFVVGFKTADAMPVHADTICSSSLGERAQSSSRMSMVADLIVDLVVVLYIDLAGPWGQIHQHFMRSFYALRSQKRKKDSQVKQLLHFWDLRM